MREGESAILILFRPDRSIEVMKRRRKMKCPKCTGLMVMQSFFDHFINFEGWKCLNCGKIVEKRENTIKDDAFSLFYQRQKIKKQGN
jgi:DNA-directed RNA polymerase subunit RPC12/RpoP